MTIKKCAKCNNEFDDYSKWGPKKYCSRSCANSHHVSAEHKNKTRKSIISYLKNLTDDQYTIWLQKTHKDLSLCNLQNKLYQYKEKQFKLPRPRKFNNHEKNFNDIISGPYSKVYRCVCKYSGKIFYSATPKQVHPELSRTKSEYARSCQFRFGISSYPMWFTNASELINKYGWYSTPGSKKGIKNINGISRDHLYSITDGWLNKIPPSIIRHPANCELIPHIENQKKHKKSKITIEELYHRIEEFEKLAALYGNAPHSSVLETDASL